MFELNGKENAVAILWKKAHAKKHVMKSVAAISGRWSYIFTPNSIGTAITVRCICGEEKDVTNYDDW